MRAYWWIFFAAMWTLAGCGGQQMVAPANELGIEVNVSVAPSPPMVGESTLVVSLTEEDGSPIDGADIAVRGDMNRAGVEPILREGSTSQNGDYLIPFEWTDSGEWYVVVTATLPDGRIVEQQFDFTVGM